MSITFKILFLNFACFLLYTIPYKIRLLMDLKTETYVPFITDKKENQIFPIYKEIQSGVVAKSYMRKGFLINEEMEQIFPHI